MHPQTLDVIRTRAEYFGFELIIDSAEKALDYDDVFGVLLQQTGTGGQIHDYRELLAQLHQRQVITSVAADIMALVLLEAPANRARISSSAQPSVLVCRWATAALMLPSLPAVMLTNVRCRAVLSGYPLMPPVTVLCVWRCKPANSISAVKSELQYLYLSGSAGKYRGMYAVYHGPEGLKRIAGRIHRLTDILAKALTDAGLRLRNTTWFDTLTIEVQDKAAVLARAKAARINLRTDLPGAVAVTLSETTQRECGKSVRGTDRTGSTVGY